MPVISYYGSASVVLAWILEARVEVVLAAVDSVILTAVVVAIRAARVENFILRFFKIIAKCIHFKASRNKIKNKI